MKSSDLKHGDILLYNWQEHQSFYERDIRFITGNVFVHCSIVQQTDLVTTCADEILDVIVILEQLQERRCEAAELYVPDPGCCIVCMRPKFTPSSFNINLVNHASYNYWAIADSMINHLLHRLTLRRWQFKPMLSKINADLRDCSQLVGEAVGLHDDEWLVIEPDDFFNDPRFENLGVVEWER